MNKRYIAWWILGLILLVVDVSVVISLFRKSDERREMIVWRASTYTFSIVIVMLVLDCVVTLFSAVFNVTILTSGLDNHSSSFSTLTIISIIYFVTLKYNQRKCGN